jgi:hypothetical protein
MLEKLKEYKELISIVVFFLGGIFWIQSQFPTKVDLKSELGVVNCLLEKYMTLTQLQMKGKDIERRIQEQSSQINNLGGATVALSPAMQQELDAKKADLAANRSDAKTNLADIQKISDELQRNACGRVPR